MISFFQWFLRYSLILENGCEPKNHLYDENGLGWGLAIIQCLVESMSELFSIA